MKLPENHEPYTDKYLLRSRKILEQQGLNPFVTAQVFISEGPGIVAGINEAIELILNYTSLEKGQIWALPEKSGYSSKETIMLIHARIQNIIELETMYLGVISSATTKANDSIDINPRKVKENMKAVVKAAERPVVYFGARHWHWSQDKEISKAAFDGGATDCSTDIGAENLGKKGIGTIPHAMENIYAYYYGRENAVKESTKAFDRIIAGDIPRISLVDYNNSEIDDTLATAGAVKSLKGVRIDTPGENVCQGADESGNRPYWGGKGVTISGVYAVKKALEQNCYDKKIMLSSGFGNTEKVKAFVNAEHELQTRLFDSLGVGKIYPARTATMDIVKVGETPEDMKEISKTGRAYSPNKRLERWV